MPARTYCPCCGGKGFTVNDKFEEVVCERCKGIGMIDYIHANDEPEIGEVMPDA